jgi:hypothetical protein
MTAVLEPLVEEVASDARPVITARDMRITPIDPEKNAMISAAFAQLAESARASAQVVRARMEWFVTRVNYEPVVWRTRDDTDAAQIEWYHAAAVERGVELLDVLFTRDVWLARMNVDTLDVVSGDRCALAQASGIDYSRAMVRYGIADSHRYGFSTLYDFEALTQAWVAKIKELRAAAGDSVRITA